MTQYLVSVLTEGAIFGIMALGLNVIWGWSGDFDLAYYGYIAVGAYMTLVLTIGPAVAPAQYILGEALPYPLAVLFAVVTTMAVALIVGSIALRHLRGIYFSIVTLGAVYVIYVIAGQYVPLVDGYNGLSGLFDPMGDWFGLDYLTYQYFFMGLSLAVFVVVFLFMWRVSGSRFGMALRTMREDERASAAFGRDIYRLKLKGYVLGAALGGLAGALFAAYLSAFNPSAWSPVEIIVLYSAVLVGGRGNIWGVALGVLIMGLLVQESTRFLPRLPGLGELDALHPQFLLAMRGVIIGLVLVLFLRFRPQGLLPERRFVDREPPSAGCRSGATNRVSEPARTAALEVRALTKRFGGVLAVDSCSFEAPLGQVTGLIGPNGAGKSTAIDLISGFKLPDSGTVLFEGKSLVGLPPHVISRLGLIRTFQAPREWPGLTVLENVVMARWDPGREGFLQSLVGVGRAQRVKAADERTRAREIIEEFGLSKLRNERAGNLSGGQKRLVEFARIRMAAPKLVILDEPMGGVNPVLGERMAVAIEGFIAAGTSVIVVEHNLPFIERVTQHVIVMAQGAVIAEGPFETLRANRDVIDAYLGEMVRS